MRDNKAISALSGIILTGAIFSIAYSISGGFGPPLNSAPFEQAGVVLARQALACLKPGGHITVIARDTAAFLNPASDYQLAAFRKELKKSGAKIDAMQSIQIDPLRPTIVPPGDFLQWIKQASEKDVLVSFMGPPIFNESQMAQLGDIKPAIVAFCTGPSRDQVDLRALFGRGLLRGAVVSKRSRASGLPVSTGSRELFDSQFIEVTAANLASLPPLQTPAP
ncbi:MAG TPA: hypothetical protein VKY92_27265 [Verrucomicrobiae bacterium]|nr:hypothetical protein [Verrucomicrobiae bacterium]